MKRKILLLLLVMGLAVGTRVGPIRIRRNRLRSDELRQCACFAMDSWSSNSPSSNRPISRSSVSTTSRSRCRKTLRTCLHATARSFRSGVTAQHSILTETPADGLPASTPESVGGGYQQATTPLCPVPTRLSCVDGSG